MFRERIKSAYDDLSPSFQRLATFLMDHPYEAAFMTATQLGRELEVDTATVVRFAQRLDYPGFPELLHEIQAEVKSRLVAYFQPAAGGGAGSDVFRESVRLDKANIEQFELTLTQTTIDRLLDLIRHAERILVVGEGLSRSAADYLAFGLRMFRYDVLSLPTEASTAAVELRTAGPKDVVIAVAEIQHCPDVTSIVEVARERGVQTICLAGAQSWPVARAAAVTVLCPSASKGVRSMATINVAINAILQMLFFERRETLVDEIVSFEDVLHKLMTSRSQVDIEPLLNTDDFRDVLSVAE